MTVRAVFRRTVGAQWPILLVGSIFAVGFVLAGANFWRRGALLIGIGVGVAAVLRLVHGARVRRRRRPRRRRRNTLITG